MLINLYDDPDGEPFATNVNLAEAFPEPDDYEGAFNALTLQGQYWCGGGAAPAIFVTLVPQFHHGHSAKALGERC